MSRAIKRALISVYDKTGIVDFARTLADEFGIEILSTGGTATLLKENGIPVTPVEDVTGSGEMLDGRVKTLHPNIHGAILADRDNPEHMRQLAERGIKPIDMVVVNLYPFEKTVADPHCTFEQAIEMIDIGGPCMLRAAAKNHKHVLAVAQSSSYEMTLSRLRNWRDDHDRLDALRSGAFSAFCETHAYDAQIATWLSMNDKDALPDVRILDLWSWGALRYGENPHQLAEVLSLKGDTRAADLTTVDPVSESADDPRESGKALSFNNYVDANAALDLCEELSCAGLPSVACYIKHTPPCGVGVGTDPLESYR
ncbi:MAG: bifunctional phosphoribosylaminoimidazolecarboxamide formyltransferase/IMP cyclohydrolase, partial [Candidatus Binatia bacterium]